MTRSWLVLLWLAGGCGPQDPSPRGGDGDDSGSASTLATAADPLVPDDEFPPPPCVPDIDCDDVGHCWVTICRGSFPMGSDDPEHFANERPVHEVAVPGFEILQTEVTWAQYQACRDAGACTWHDDPPAHCGPHSDDTAMVCLDWFMARDYCAFVGARLPSEAEWEYAARSEGQDHLYPWGDAPLTCDHLVKSQEPCNEPISPVCTKPLGFTEQGLCDMAGNAIEWVQDWFHDSYDGAPADGSPWEDPAGWARVFRGGGVNSGVEPRNANRTFHAPDFWYGGAGFRCTRPPGGG